MEDNHIKLLGEVYKILDFIPEGDPLKHKAKNKALEVMENIARDAESAKDIELLEGYLRLANFQQWVSDMNFLIVSNELRTLKNSLQARLPARKDDAVLLLNTLLAPQKAAENARQISARQKKIIHILSTAQKAQVADLVKKIPDITKRTIRRDLDDLLKKGRVVRVGEWNQVFYKVSR